MCSTLDVAGIAQVTAGCEITNFRKNCDQALQPMYHFKVKADGKDEFDLLDLAREIPVAELPVPVRNKR